VAFVQQRPGLLVGEVFSYIIRFLQMIEFVKESPWSFRDCKKPIVPHDFTGDLQANSGTSIKMKMPSRDKFVLLHK
jgi:hypothetical protein